MKFSFFVILLFTSFAIHSQNNERVPANIIPGGEHINFIEFHVEGMNTIDIQNTVVNSINKYSDKIISWSPNISIQTIKIGFTNAVKPIDILEIINSTGYKPWYLNENGRKVVLVGTNQTQEWYIKQ